MRHPRPTCGPPGAVAATSDDHKFQADIIDYKQFSKKANDGFQHALSVTNALDRKTNLLFSKSKEPKEVWQKFMAIVGKFRGEA